MANTTRILWANSLARKVWEPRIRAISQAWFDVELTSVSSGLRLAAITFDRPGLIERLKALELHYHEVTPHRLAVAEEPDALTMFVNDWTNRDDRTVGLSLGYPTCCRAFFECVKVPGDADTTWEMTNGYDWLAIEPHGDCMHMDAPDSWRVREVSGPVECNILGRWLGVRLVPHLPCSFYCESTVRFARRLESLWPRQELAWAREILSWPVEWSAVHGIAEVRFPILKLATYTTVFDNRTVRRQGTAYPAEGARGLSFPYRMPPAVSSPLVFKRRSVSGPVTTWTENGFPSLEAMERAHRFVLDALHASPPQYSVLDLGCGNGRLLARVRKEFALPEDQVLGVEVDARKALGNSRIIIGNLRDVERLIVGSYDTVLVSQRRFEEIPTLEAWSRAHARQILVYSYDEPMFARFLKNKETI